MNEPRENRVGRYELLAKVGQGAMGMVYRAQDPTIRRVVALKVVPADPADSTEATGVRSRGASLFEREAQAAGALLHPNIVTLYDAGRDGDWYYLAMEFIEGRTFAAEIAEAGKVSVDRAIEVGAAVAEALDFAHERGVVHRDIKPANLMILPDDTVKVADFGIARLASASATMTTDAVVGTPHYMSPEQVRGGAVDGRSDLFSLGVVLYQALTGRKPYASETLAGILNAILTTAPPAAHAVEASVPPALSAVVARAMARDAAKRYARGKDLAADLRKLRAAEGGAEPARRRGPVVAVAAGAALLALAAAAALVVSNRAAPPSGEPAAVAAAPGWVRFVSEPAGAEISVDGKIVGRTPYTVEVPEGSHEIEYSKDGYFPGQTTVRVVANERIEVPLSMVPR